MNPSSPCTTPGFSWLIVLMIWQVAAVLFTQLTHSLDQREDLRAPPSTGPTGWEVIESEALGLGVDLEQVHTACCSEPFVAILFPLCYTRAETECLP